MNCLAIDIGAGSGRIIRGTFANGKIRLDEVHRFKNGMRRFDGHLRWDIDGIFDEICKGLRKASKAKEGPSSIGIDTWGVDYVLLDKDSELLGQPVAYRDGRTDGMMDRFLKIMGRQKVYRRTGIQFIKINTLYQLFAQARKEPAILRKAKHILMVPDYLNFRLAGKKCMEFTEATTTQMLNVSTRDWDKEILRAIPVGPELLTTPVEPGTIVGPLSPEVQARTGLGKVPVVTPATHDTGSAVASIPAKGKDWAFISSGTWSLIGMEVPRPIVTKKALDHNFTNEGGVCGTYRFLKNIMGMWLVSGLRETLPGKPSYKKLEALARTARPFRCFVDPNDGLFFNPRSMRSAFDKYLKRTGQPRMSGPKDYIRCALESLALSYREVLSELRSSQAGMINKVHIIGGGCQNRLLDQMTADALDIPVYAGPIEGTAVGNLIVQAMALGEVRDISEGRRLVYNSFNIEQYIPKDAGAWDEAWSRFRDIKGMKHVR